MNLYLSACYEHWLTDDSGKRQHMVPVTQNYRLTVPVETVWVVRFADDEASSVIDVAPIREASPVEKHWKGKYDVN